MTGFRCIALITILWGGCDPYDIEAIGSTEQELYLTNPKWPNGIVPVCWTAASQAFPGFAQIAQKVKDTANASWPAVANIEFTGWGSCPSNTDGITVIDLTTDGESSVPEGGYDDDRPTNVSLGTNGASFPLGGVVPHEFGHVLGFTHEMRRSDFEDGAGDCQEADVPGGDTLGTPPDIASIMTHSYCHNDPLLSRWDLVGVRTAYGTRAENVISTGSTLYARKRSNGDIYARIGSSWVRIGGPGGQFVTVGSTLYALSPSGGGVHRYSGSGTTWTQIGTAAKEILRCGSSLCAVSPGDNDLKRYSGSGTSWSVIGGPAAMYASTLTTLYRITLARDAVEVYAGSGSTWTAIGGPAGFIFATTDRLFATSSNTGRILRYSSAGGGSWTDVGGPGRTFVGVGSTLYALSRNRDSVHRYSGSGTVWTQVGTAADWIYGGPLGSLYSTHPTTKDIWQLNGSNWTNLGQP
jgi:hypothetical protein